MSALQGLNCTPHSSTNAVAPEVIRSANRLGDNEGKAVVVDGVAVEVAGRACIQLDRNDAIVPVAGRAAWDADLLARVVRGRGVLTRHAPANDPATGIASLELAQPSVELLALPVDGRIRTAPALHAAEGSSVEVEGVPFHSRNGPMVILYGGGAYVRGLPDWKSAIMRENVVVRGTVRHPPLPPEAPQAGGSWAIEATGFETVSPR